MSVKIFIINLRSSVERRRFIEKQLSNVQLDFEFIDAYEAVEIDHKDLEYANSYGRYVEGINKKEIACTKSHIKALKALAQDQTCTHGLIIEDDVYLSRDLSQILARLIEMHKPEDIVLLYSIILNQTEFSSESELYSEYRLAKPDHYRIVGAQAYFLSKDKAKEFADKLTPITTKSDDWNYFLGQKFFSDLYVVYPFPVLHAELLSNIREKNFTGILGALKRLIIKNKIFPIYHLYFARRRREAEIRQRYYIYAPEFERTKTYKL